MKSRIIRFRDYEDPQITREQIVKSLREHDGGRSAKAICRELGISSATFYQCKRKYDGLVSWSRKLGQRFRNYKLRNYEKDQTRIQFGI